MNQKEETPAQAFYNSVPNSGVKERAMSRIYHQRNFSNWMKSQLIGRDVKGLVRLDKSIYLFRRFHKEASSG